MCDLMGNNTHTCNYVHVTNYVHILCCAVQYITAQHSAVQYSTVQYSTVQYSIAKHSTVQYSSVEHLHIVLYQYYMQVITDSTYVLSMYMNMNIPSIR